MAKKTTKNAKKQAYPVDVTTDNGKVVPAGTPVVIDEESSQRIVETFGVYTGDAPAPSASDLDAPAVQKAIADAAAAAVEPVEAAIVAAREAFEAFQTLPNDASEEDAKAALDALAAALAPAAA